MKLTLIFLTVLLEIFGFSEIKEIQLNPMTKVISEIIKNHKLESDVTVTIVNFISSDDFEYEEANSIIDLIIKNEEIKFPMQNFDWKHVSNSTKVRKFFNIILTSNLSANIEALTKFFKDNSFHHQGYSTVVSLREYKNQYEDMQLMFASLWSVKIINVNILMTGKNNEIEIFTIFSNHSGKCNEVVVEKINSNFSEAQDFFPKKMNFLNKCKLRINLFLDVPFVIVNDRKFDGIDGNLVESKLIKLIFRLKMLLK